MTAAAREKKTYNFKTSFFNSCYDELADNSFICHSPGEYAELLGCDGSLTVAE